MTDPDNILPWPIDYSDRRKFVRPIPPSHIARQLGDPEETIDLYVSLEEQQRIDRIVIEIRQERRLGIVFWTFMAITAIVCMALVL